GLPADAPPVVNPFGPSSAGTSPSAHAADTASGPSPLGFPTSLSSPRARSRGLLSRFGAIPKGTRFGLIGGTAAVLLLAALGLSGVFSGGGPPSPKHATPATPAPPPFPVQEYKDERGFTINIPADWTRSGSGKSYFDFTDPQDNGRRIRVNVESAGSTPKAFLQVVAGVLSKDPRKCPAPYATVNLRSDVTLGGRPAAELEYTCGTGPDMR